MDPRYCHFNQQDMPDIIKVPDEKLALAFFSASIAFRVVDNPYINDFIETLSSTNIQYKAPCRQTLASTILDLLYEKSPIQYWSILQMRYPNLSKYAIKLMLIPASTALLESLFSQWTYVHNIYRNKLGEEKSSHLLDIYHSLRSLNIKLHHDDPVGMEVEV